MKAAHYWILPVIKTSQMTPGQCIVFYTLAAVTAWSDKTLVYYSETKKIYADLRDGGVSMSRIRVEFWTKTFLVRCGWDYSAVCCRLFTSGVLTPKINSHAFYFLTCTSCLIVQRQHTFLSAHISLYGHYHNDFLKQTTAHHQRDFVSLSKWGEKGRIVFSWGSRGKTEKEKHRQKGPDRVCKVTVIKNILHRLAYTATADVVHSHLSTQTVLATTSSAT